MTATLQDSNATLRRAVETRLATGSYDEFVTLEDGPATTVTKDEPTPKVYGHDGCCRGPSAAEVVERFAAAGTRAEQTLRQAIDAVRDRHTKYGPPTTHFARTASLVNAAFGTAFTAADWALVMVLDKVSRQLGDCQTDDAAVDIAGYAACHQECRG
jgi:hypothetical protein